MKVLWVTNKMLPDFLRELGLPPNNYGGWMPALLAAIKQYGPEIEVHVCSAGPEDKRIKVNGVYYYSLGSTYEGWIVHKVSNKFLKSFSALLKEIQPDIVHFHGSEGLLGVIPGELYSSYKSVVSLQGILQGYYPHYAGGISESEIKDYRNYLNLILTRHSVSRGADSWRKKMGPAESLALSKVKNIFGRTEWDKAWAKYISPEARYFHVGEVLRPEFYLGKRSEENVRRYTVFCGGAMTYSLKGGHWLIRAVGALKSKYPEIKLRVANAERVSKPTSFKEWIRRGEYHRYCWRLIEQYDLEDNIILLPSLDANEVAEELRQAEVFCLPSCCENSPNSLGEAMLIGTPSIATYVGGVPSVARDGDNCILVPSCDPACLAHGIDQVFENPCYAKQLAENAYAFAVKRYQEESVVQQLKNSYMEILRR